MKKLVLFCMLLCGLSIASVQANGIVVSNVSLLGQNITNQTWQVQFDLTWNNSWRDGLNYDAAWIFIKFRVNNGQWRHAYLNPAGFSTGTGTGTELRISTDNVGAMANRSVTGDGTYAVTGMQLQWNYGTSNVSNTDLPQVRVLAIEMVQIPEGPFAIGDGNGSSESTSALGVADNRYYVVGTELSPSLRADATFSNGNNIIRIDGDGGVDNNGDGIIDNANYPVGYKAFFMMKYNITQEQYADFLSMLFSTQYAARFMSMNGTARNTIQASGGSFFASIPDRACNYLGWTDGVAYADWAGLRPFTETEFEKACRGDRAPVIGEYAWGSTSFNPALNTTPLITLSGTEDGTETTNNTSNNVLWLYSSVNTSNFIANGSPAHNGPVRVGLMVNATGGSRQNSGTSYYGVVDLTGNVSEQMYNITSTNGRQFTGTHGNGEINSSGIADVSGWPTSGMGFKRVTHTTSNTFPSSNTALYTVSYRGFMESQLGRDFHAGFRCARSQWW